MAIQITVSQGLSGRALAAGAILTLHVLVAYLLLTALMPPPLAVPPAMLARLEFAPPRNPLPPQLVPRRPALVNVHLDTTTPPEISLPSDSPPVSATPGSADALAGGTALAAPVRVLGRHRLPNTEDYYPPELIRLGVQGASLVRVCVDERGLRQGDPAIEKSSGNARLDRGAINVARHGQYARAVQGDTPVANCYRFQIAFKVSPSR